MWYWLSPQLLWRVSQSLQQDADLPGKI